MKALYLIPAVLSMSLLPMLPIRAQDDPSGAIVADVKLSREQLRELAGPVALYPDPLLSMILPASTFPSDVVLAARFVQSGDDPSLADEKPWDESIRGLTRYPDVLTWMDENLEWTTQLGYAYLAQPEDVMDVVQELRAQAQTVGNLVDTPQQRIVREETYIRIVPTEPEYIYVPYYDPEIVYYERPYSEPFITFSSPWLVGTWLTFDFDWHRHRLYCGDWHGHWDYRHRDGRHDHHGENIFINNSFTNYSVWRGDSRRRLGSTRNFATIRESLRSRALASPSFFSERFDLRQRERFAVPVKQEIRERDRRDAITNLSQAERERARTLDRDRFDANGRIRSREGERATLTSIADREQERLATEAKKREEFRKRLAAEGKLSERSRERERERDAKSVGVGAATGKTREGERIGAEDSKKGKGKMGPDGRVTERTLPGETIKPAEVPKTGPGGRATDRTPVPGEAPKIGETPRPGERGKSGVPIPRGTPPTVTGEEGKGKGKGKDADRGPTGRTEIPKAELPTERPGVREMPKTELPKGRPESRDIPKAELPKGRPEVKEMPKAPTPAPVIPDDRGKGKSGERSRVDDDAGKGKGKNALPGPSPRTEVPRVERPVQPKVDTPPRVERPVQPKVDTTPRVAPQPRQEVPKARPTPPVNVEPPKPRVQQPPPSPQRKKDEPSARRSPPSAPNVARPAPVQRPSAPAVERRSAPKPPVVAAPRPQPQKPQAGGGSNKKNDDEKKKDRR